MPKMMKRGGGIIDSFLSAITPSDSIYHPYLAGASPNFIQTLSHKWNGALDPVPRSSNPVDFSWQFKTSPELRAITNPSVSISSRSPTTASRSNQLGGRRTYMNHKSRKSRKTQKSRKSRKSRNRH